MRRTNRNWLPSYCDPEAHLPKIPETRTLFQWRPVLAQDFIGKAISFLSSPEVKKMGLEYDPRRAIPCRWKCSDESLFGVDLAMWAYTRSYPFAKGKIGGRFNAGSIGAAVHHGTINVDLGGSHVGYLSGDNGGEFGKIWRPATKEYSTDCGYLLGVLEPFQKVFHDACETILIFKPDVDRAMVSIPNEYVQPTWSTQRVKLLVDLDRLTDGEVEYERENPHTFTKIGRSLFYLHPSFLDRLGEDQARALCTPKPRSIGGNLSHRYFNIWDSEETLHNGLPEQRLLMYMKFILAAKHSPAALKVAIVNTTIEHNSLTDAVRDDAYRPYDFISFSGIFIDQYSLEAKSYVNLFVPMGMTIKPQGRSREYEFSPEEIHDILDRMPLAKPALPLEAVLSYPRPDSVVESFSFEPGRFQRR